MSKLKMQTPDLTHENIARLAELFPDCVTESRDGCGNVTAAIDFDQLRQVLSDHVADGPQERYHLNWPGKREALLAANAPIAMTLRPHQTESVQFDTTRNLFIEGDNLDALKLLQDTYLGKVKMIYIDPPYNSGADCLYNDDFAEDASEFLLRSEQIDDTGQRLVANTESNGRFHSDWLSMLYPRLRLARTLLADDGLIFISIDDNENASLRFICDEIFGRDNFVDAIVWKKRYGGGAKEKYLVALHEYILVYARSKSQLANLFIPLDQDSIKRYYKNKDEHFSTKGPYRTHPLEAMKSFGARENLRFPIPAPNGDEVWPKRQWRWSRERVAVALEQNEIEFAQDKAGNWVLSSKQYLKDDNGEVRKTKPFTIIDDVYTQHGTNEIVQLFGDAQVFGFPKPSGLLKQLITIGLNGDQDGIVLDFFAGSATTAHAVMQLNAEDGGTRKFILIQLPEKCDDDSQAKHAGFDSIADIGKSRIRKVGESIVQQQDLASHRVDVGFRLLTLDSSNMKPVYYRPDEATPQLLGGHVDNVKEDRSDEDLLFQVLLDWGVDLTLPLKNEKIAGKSVFFVDENALAACFETGIDEAFVKELAGRKPLRAVFRDAGYGGDDVKINVEQIFKQLSPGTEVKTL